MNKKLEAIRRIEDENRRRPIAEVLADLNSGKHAKDLRVKFDAAGVTAEDYTQNELWKCDIYVDGDQIAYQVTEVYPEVSRRQVLTWLCSHAESHHEIFGTI